MYFEQFILACCQLIIESIATVHLDFYCTVELDDKPTYIILNIVFYFLLPELIQNSLRFRPYRTLQLYGFLHVVGATVEMVLILDELMPCIWGNCITYPYLGQPQICTVKSDTPH